MRKIGTFFLALSCASIAAYQAKASVSPSFAELKRPIRLAVLPPELTGAEGFPAAIEVNSLLPGDVTPGSVYVDGREMGSIDWVEGSARVPVQPGSHEVRVYEFMGDELGRTRVYVRKGELVRLTLTEEGLSVSGREALPKDKGLSPEFAVNALSAEALRTAKFSLVERAKLEAVLKEQELGASGLVDPAKAVELGRLAGAEAVLVAQCSFQMDPEMGSWLATLSGRIISTETGEILYAARSRGVAFNREAAFEQAASAFFKELR